MSTGTQLLKVHSSRVPTFSVSSSADSEGGGTTLLWNYGNYLPLHPA